jgi:carbamoyl-phosphate synthase large subunit
MGVGATFAEAFVKSQLAAGEALPSAGKVFISVRDGDKPKAVEIARKMASLGYGLVATRGTAAAIAAAGLNVAPVNKVQEGRPHIVDMVKNGEIALIVNTVEETRTAVKDSYSIRRAALQERVALYTTLAGARAACAGMEHARDLHPYAMQALHEKLPAGRQEAHPLIHASTS